MLQRKLLADLTATLDYAYGGVLDLSRPDVELQDAREWIRTERRHAVAAKFSGTDSACEYALDRFVSLDQRSGSDARRSVQCVGRAV